MPTGLEGTGLTSANHEWVIDFSRFRQAWALPPRPGGKAKGEGIVIAHPDTGTTQHPELSAPRYIRDPAQSRNFFAMVDRPDADPPPPFDQLISGILTQPGHGTSTASVLMSSIGHPDGHPPGTDLRVAAFPKEDPRAFVTGVAPLASVLPFKVVRSRVLLDDKSDEALVKCIYHCIELQRQPNSPVDVAVMSVSLGRPIWMGGVEKKVGEALAAARKNGIVVCAAAGQGDSELLSIVDPAYPGSDPNVICVAACTSTGAKMADGFYGPEVDITAPGVDVWIADCQPPLPGNPTRFYVTQSKGTSYATAIVAGACALWQAHHGRKKLIDDYGLAGVYDAFRYCLQESSRPNRPSDWDLLNRGVGILDAEALLKLPLPTQADLANPLTRG
jgi:serine protease